MIYVPFLKAKQNEIRAISSLSKNRRSKIIPFFDIARPSDLSLGSVISNVKSAKRNIDLAQSKDRFWFYLDIYDIPSGMVIDDVPLYEYTLNFFQDYEVIPVVGLDREPAHLDSVLKTLGERSYVAIRLLFDDIVNFDITKPELDSIFSQFPPGILFDLIIDLRVIDERNYFSLANLCSEFIDKCRVFESITNIIVASSSIPAAISTLVEPQSSEIILRNEYHLWECLRNKGEIPVVFGDYTVVSPEYSDVSIPAELMRRVQCPKIIYSSLESSLIVRGGALQTHGDSQFYDLADNIVNSKDFRGESYSYGDSYIFNVSKRKLTKKIKGGGTVNICGNASKWIEVTVNCHISFIADMF